MHGQQNIKICDANQAKQVHHYKNIKIKSYKSNAAIWHNKTCRIKQLIPTYVNVRVKGNNSRCQRTKNAHKFCASCWLIAKINILKYTVSKTLQTGL